MCLRRLRLDRRGVQLMVFFVFVGYVMTEVYREIKEAYDEHK